MLPAVLLTFPLFVVASHPNAAALLPRQTAANTAVNTADPCYTKVFSLYASEPTLPPVYVSWHSSIFATVTDNCTAFNITGTILSAYSSYMSSVEAWSESHLSEITSLTSACATFLSSEVSANRASLSSFQASCRSKHSSAIYSNTTKSAAVTNSLSTTPTATLSASSTATTSTTTPTTAAASRHIGQTGSIGAIITSCVMAAMAAIIFI